MLVLTRRLRQKLVFPGIGTTVEVVALNSRQVRLGIDAPADVEVWREEITRERAGPPVRGCPPDWVALERLLDKRLDIANQGLALLRDQLAGGRPDDALATLDDVAAELALLRARVRFEAARPVEGDRKLKALLVEDNPQERELLALVLRTQGLDVETAGDGADALDFIRDRGQPDCVLLDMGLPRLDGPATVHELRRNPAYAGLKIFAVSGHAADEYDLVVGSEGVDQWFQKPVDPDALVRHLNRALDVTRGDRAHG